MTTFATTYAIAVGNQTYPATWAAFLAALDGYLTRVDALDTTGWTGNINANNNKLTNLALATNGGDAVNKTYADNLAFTANAGILPGQGGNAGKFLSTNGTTASWSAVLAGANQLTTDQAPTTDGNAVYWFTGSGDGLVVTLPAATSLSTGVRFYFGNDSGFQGGILYNTGELLHTVLNGKGAILELLDASTAAGKWRVIPVDAALLQNLTALRGAAGTHNGQTSIVIGDMVQVATDLFVCAYRGTSTGIKIRAISVSGRTVTIGSEYSTGASTPNQIRIIKGNTNAVTVLSADATTLTAVPVAVSGTTLTVGTSVNLTTTLSNANGGVPIFDACQPPANGSPFAAAFVDSSGLKCSSFTQGSGASSWSNQTTSTATALTGGVGVVGVAMPLSTANLVGVFYLDTYSAGAATLKTARYNSLNTTPVLLSSGGSPSFNNTGANSVVGTASQPRNIGFTLGVRGITGTDRVAFAYGVSGSGSWNIAVWDIGTNTVGAGASMSASAGNIAIGCIIAESSTKLVVSTAPWTSEGGGKIINVTISGTTVTAPGSTNASPAIISSGFTQGDSQWRESGLVNVDTNLYAFAYRDAAGTFQLSCAIVDTSAAAPVLKQRNGSLTAPEFQIVTPTAPSTTPSGMGRNWFLSNSGYRLFTGFYQDGPANTSFLTIQISKKVS